MSSMVSEVPVGFVIGFSQSKLPRLDRASAIVINDLSLLPLLNLSLLTFSLIAKSYKNKGLLFSKIANHLVQI